MSTNVLSERRKSLYFCSPSNGNALELCRLLTVCLLKEPFWRNLQNNHKKEAYLVYHVTWIAYSKPKNPLNSQKWCATARGLPWVQVDSLFWSSITMKRHVVRQLRGTCLPRLPDHSCLFLSALLPAGAQSLSLVHRQSFPRRCHIDIISLELAHKWDAGDDTALLKIIFQHVSGKWGRHACVLRLQLLIVAFLCAVA